MPQFDPSRLQRPQFDPIRLQRPKFDPLRLQTKTKEQELDLEVVKTAMDFSALQDTLASTVVKSTRGISKPVTFQPTKEKSGFFRNIGELAKRGLESTNLDEKFFDAALTGKDYKPLLEESKKQRSLKPIEGQSFLEDAVYLGSGTLGYMAKLGTAAGASALTVGAIVGNVPDPTDIVTVPAAMMGAGTAAAFYYGAKQGAGSSIRSMLEAGVDANVAAPIGILVGIPYGLAEQSQLLRIPGLGKGVKKIIQKKALPILLGYFKERGLDYIIENVEEVAQEMSLIAGEEFSKLVDNSVNKKDLDFATGEEIKERLKTTAAQSAKAFLPIMAVGSLGGAGRVNRQIQTGKIVQALEKEKPYAEKIPLQEPTKMPVVPTEKPAIERKAMVKGEASVIEKISQKPDFIDAILDMSENRQHHPSQTLMVKDMEGFDKFTHIGAFTTGMGTEFFKDEAYGISKADVKTIAKKLKAGKQLTENQQDIWNAIVERSDRLTKELKEEELTQKEIKIQKEIEDASIDVAEEKAYEDLSAFFRSKAVEAKPGPEGKVVGGMGRERVTPTPEKLKEEIKSLTTEQRQLQLKVDKFTKKINARLQEGLFGATEADQAELFKNAREEELRQLAPIQEQLNTVTSKLEDLYKQEEQVKIRKEAGEQEFLLEREIPEAVKPEAISQKPRKTFGIPGKTSIPFKALDGEGFVALRSIFGAKVARESESGAIIKDYDQISGVTVGGRSILDVESKHTNYDTTVPEAYKISTGIDANFDEILEEAQNEIRRFESGEISKTGEILKIKPSGKELFEVEEYALKEKKKIEETVIEVGGLNPIVSKSGRTVTFEIPRIGIKTTMNTFELSYDDVADRIDKKLIMSGIVSKLPKTILDRKRKQIHVLKNKIGLSDNDYTDMMNKITKREDVEHFYDLTVNEYNKVIRKMQGMLAGKDKTIKSIKNKLKTRNLKWGYQEKLNDLKKGVLLKTTTRKEIESLDRFAKFVKEQLALGVEIKADPEKLAELGKKNLNKMSISELKILEDVIASTIHQGKIKNKLIIKQYNKTIDKITAVMAGEIRRNKPPEIPKIETGKRDPEKWYHKIKDWDRELTRIERFLEHAGMGTNSLTYKMIFEVTNDADNDYVLNSQKAHKELRNYIIENHQDMKSIFKVPKDFKPIRLNDRLNFSPNFYKMAYIYSKQELSLDHLINGNKFTQQDLIDIKKFVESDKLSMKDVEYALDLMKKYYPKIDAIHLKIYGVHLPKRFAYFHFFTTDVEAGLEKLENMTQILEKPTFVAQSLEKGMIKERKGGTSSMALDFWGNLSQSIDIFEKYAAMGLAERDVRKFINHPDFKNNIKEIFGNDWNTDIKNWFGDTYGKPPHQRLSVIDKTFQYLRLKSPISLLYFNATVPPRQVGSIVLSFSEVGLRHGIPALTEFATNPIGISRIIYEKDPIQRYRRVERDIAEMTHRYEETHPKALSGRKGAFEIGIAPVIFFDKLTVNATWWMAYKKFLSKNRKRIGDTEKLDRLAIRHAQYIVRKTQPAWRKKDLSSLYRNSGEITKMLTMFQNFPNQLYNYLMKDTFQASLDKRISKTQLISHLWWTIVVSSFIYGMSRRWRLPTKKEFLIDIATYPLGFVPLGRDFSMMLESRLLNKRVYPEFSTPPLIFFNSAGHIIAAKKPKTMLKYGIKTAAYYFGAPYAQPYRTYKGISDLVEGETEDWRRIFISEWALEKPPEKKAKRLDPTQWQP